jgi:hypothetical protein
MTSVAVLVPWAGACPYRTVAFSYVRSWYAEHHPDWQICVGEATAGPQWCKAEAVRNAVRQTSADVLIVADADCFAPRVGEAVQAVEQSYAWAMPHYTVHRLTNHATKQLVEAGQEPSQFPRNVRYYAQMPYTGYAGGGIAVLKREAYAECPLDPRFIGWGQEDESWAIGLKSLYGAPWRPQRGPLWHLWHPPQRRSSRSVGSASSGQLRSAYRQAAVQRTMEGNLATARAYIQGAMEEGSRACSASQG